MKTRRLLLACLLLILLTSALTSNALETTDFTIITKEQALRIINTTENADLPESTKAEIIRRAQAVVALFDGLEAETILPAADTSRRSPALVGKTVVFPVWINDVKSIVSAVINRSYTAEEMKGLNASTGWLGDLTPSEGNEFIAVEMTLSFVFSDFVDSLNKEPLLTTSIYSNFSLVSEDGNVYKDAIRHFYDLPEFQDIYEGASTKAFMFFEVTKIDKAPRLKYEPAPYSFSSTTQPIGWFMLRVPIL